jgi:hypothetical protein
MQLRLSQRGQPGLRATRCRQVALLYSAVDNVIAAVGILWVLDVTVFSAYTVILLLLASLPLLVSLLLLASNSC